jgi:hypothetical protein
VNDTPDNRQPYNRDELLARIMSNQESLAKLLRAQRREAADAPEVGQDMVIGWLARHKVKMSALTLVLCIVAAAWVSTRWWVFEHKFDAAFREIHADCIHIVDADVWITQAEGVLTSTNGKLPKMESIVQDRLDRELRRKRSDGGAD